MTISTITISAVDYTAYASVTEANAYLAVDPTRSTAWAALTDDVKGQYLVAATRRLDLEAWSGTKVSDSQAAAWPRTGATCSGTAVTEADVPQAVENATILLAGSMALDSSVAEMGSERSNIKAVKAGSARVQFFRGRSALALRTQAPTAYSLIRCLLAGASASVGFGCATGTSAVSSFTDADSPDVTGGGFS